MPRKRNSIAVIGIGRYGESVVNQLVKLKNFVLAIDVEEKKLTKVSRVTKTTIMDATDIDSLKSIGIQEFETVIVGATENIEIVAALIELGVKHIIAKAKSPRHARVLAQIGVDFISSPESEAGIRTALIATNSNFIKYSELLQEIGDGYAIGSTEIYNKKWLDKPLKNLTFAKFKVSVVSIKRREKILLPDGETQFTEGDVITLIGKIPAITKIFQELNLGNRMTQAIKLAKMNKAHEEAHPKDKNSKS